MRPDESAGAAAARPVRRCTITAQRTPMQNSLPSKHASVVVGDGRKRLCGTCLTGAQPWPNCSRRQCQRFRRGVHQRRFRRQGHRHHRWRFRARSSSRAILWSVGSTTSRNHFRIFCTDSEQARLPVGGLWRNVPCDTLRRTAIVLCLHSRRIGKRLRWCKPSLVEPHGAQPQVPPLPLHRPAHDSGI